MKTSITRSDQTCYTLFFGSCQKVLWQGRAFALVWWMRFAYPPAIPDPFDRVSCIRCACPTYFTFAARNAKRKRDGDADHFARCECGHDQDSDLSADDEINQRPAAQNAQHADDDRESDRERNAKPDSECVTFPGVFPVFNQAARSRDHGGLVRNAIVADSATVVPKPSAKAILRGRPTNESP